MTTRSMIERIKTFVARLPIIGTLARRLWNALRRLRAAAQANSTRLEARIETRASVQDMQKLRREILILQQRLDQLAPASTPPTAPSTGTTQGTPLPEGFYLAFENRFRGDFASIQARQSVYLPMVQQACSITANRPILDIGSGRGEWLQLLAQHTVDAYGVDADPSMVAACLDLGLDARLGNALEHLAALHAGELGVITGFHIAEHLPFAELVRLFEAAYRALQPGGVLILETPNPENLLVGACYFYTDPTHQHPLPPDLLAFVAENRGFAQVEIMRLHPFPQYVAAQAREGGASEIERFVFGAQDYALIARKPLNEAPNQGLNESLSQA